MRIVIDSNAIHRDFLLRGTSFQVLMDGVATAGHSLCVPQVVIDEVLNSFQEELRRCKNKMEAVVQDVHRIMGKAPGSPLTDDWLRSAMDAYREHLRRWLQEANVEILGYPPMSHEQVVARALSRRKPFGRGDAGYRDALIWMNVLDLAQAEGDAVAFVTENSKDFADDKGGLHPDLLADLEARALDARYINLVPGLDALIDRFVKPSMEALEEIRDQLSAGHYPLLDLREELAPLIVETYQGVEWEPADLGFPQEYENPTISWVEELSNVEVGDVRKLPGGDLLVEVEADAECSFDMFIFKADYYAMGDDSGISVWDHDWSKHYVWASTHKQVHAVIQLTFSPESKRVTSLEIQDLSSIDEGEF